jgi:hypothetical protein
LSDKASPRFNGLMPALTRRRYIERQDCWHVYCGDMHVGTIAVRVGIPFDEDPWEWSVGFYPGSRPGEHQSGTAPTFEEARAGFEAAWAFSFPGGPRPIFRLGAISAIGRQENMRCGIEAKNFPRKSRLR